MKVHACTLLCWLAVWPGAEIAAAADLTTLRSSLRFHASFDQGLSADFTQGDPALYQFTTRAQRLAADQVAVPGETLRIAPGEGRFGGALHRVSASSVRLFYKGADVIDSAAPEFSGSVSVWLRTTPDEDLPVEYCDPVMIISDDHRQGFMFIEWSKDHEPRKFRYAIVPAPARWNPSNADWEAIPDDRRPMVQPEGVTFSRDRWVHVVFTFDRVNAGEAASGNLYVDGRWQGKISGWDLTFDWNPAQVILAVGWSYVGLLDDLAVFDRALTADEVSLLTRLPGGIAGLFRSSVSHQTPDALIRP